MAAESLSDALARIKRHAAPFHIYILRCPDGSPFYIGKGGRDRARIARHEAHARTLRRSRKLSIIRGIWRAGGSVQYEVSSFHQDEREAFAEEIRLIAFFGRRDNGTGILANNTDGGDGPSGYSHTDDAKRKMKAAYPAERRGKSSAKMKSQNACPLFIQAREQARMPAVAAAQKRPERRASQSAKMKAILAADAGLLTARRAQLRSVAPSPSRSAELTAAAWADPDRRAARTAALKEAANRPELLEKRKQQALDRWACPEARKRQSEAMKAARARMKQ